MTVHGAAQQKDSSLGFDNPWLAMPFLALYGFPWLFYRPAAVELITAAAALPLFMGLFIVGHRDGARHGLACALGMAALGFATVPLTLTAAVFFIFAAALIGRAPPRESAVYVLTVLVAAVAVFGLLRHAILWQWLPVVFLCGLIGYYSYAGAALQAGNVALKAARIEAERLATEAERDRITRDLHDLLGRALTMIALKAELAGKMIDRDPARAAGEIADIQTSARQALQEVRQVVDNTRRTSIAGEIRRARAALETVGVELTVPTDVTDGLRDLPPHVEQALAFIIHEAVTNIIRHAGAAQASLTLAVVGGHIRLDIHDNGKGSDRPDGNGIEGMRTRAAELGGRFSRTYDLGTTVTAILPLEGQRQ